jgi:acetoin utilization deacetylase AcuC-like enzyme
MNRLWAEIPKIKTSVDGESFRRSRRALTIDFSVNRTDAIETTVDIRESISKTPLITLLFDQAATEFGQDYSGNNRIRFTSIHQYPGYPGTGAVSRGNVFNWPIPPRTDTEKHASAAYRALDCLLEFNPDLLLVSAGFDAFKQDPLTEMTLEQEHFANFGRRLKETGLATAAILEGGYSAELPILVETFLAEWD